MNESRETWTGGTSADKSAEINKSLRHTLEAIHAPGELFPRKHRPSASDVAEKDLARMWAAERRRAGEASGAIEKSIAPGASGRLEKVLKQSGFDKLPMTERAREVLESALANGAEPVTQYTGKVMIERGVPEVPPAALVSVVQKQSGGVLDRPSVDGADKPGSRSLQVGDRVLPLQWVDIGPHGARFDLLHVPGAARVKKIYVGTATVTKNSYPPGRAPADLSMVDMVKEDRLWGLELEPEGEAAKSAEDSPCPVLTKDTTLVLRLEPLAAPGGEV